MGRRIGAENESLREPAQLLPATAQHLNAGCGASGLSAGPSCAWDQPKKPLSALEIGRDMLLKFFDCQGARHELAVNEEGRRPGHAELLYGALEDPFDAV